MAPSKARGTWQGTAWALERLHPARFAKPEVMNQIAVVNQAGKAAPAERELSCPRGSLTPLLAVQAITSVITET